MARVQFLPFAEGGGKESSWGVHGTRLPNLGGGAGEASFSRILPIGYGRPKDGPRREAVWITA